MSENDEVFEKLPQFLTNPRSWSRSSGAPRPALKYSLFILRPYLRKELAPPLTGAIPFFAELRLPPEWI